MWGNDKEKIKASFSKHATSYDSGSDWQKGVGKHLVDMFLSCTDTKEKVILDIGMGTGFLLGELLRHERVSIAVGCDFSKDMVKLAREKIKTPSVMKIVADAESLPLPDSIFDCILSNMVFHWIAHPHNAFDEAFRTLKKGGLFLFSTVVKGTLSELKKAYDETMLNHYPYSARKTLPTFPSEENVKAAINTTGFHIKDLSAQTVEVSYESMTEMLRAFKYIGTTGMSKTSQGGLVGKKFVNYLFMYYPDELKKNDQVSCMYKILYVIAEKKG